jgi:Tfp pilus assembly protein PilF
MKSRVLGLACAAGLAAGCQSSAARALSRYQATKDKTGEVAQVSHEAQAGLPGASKRREEAAAPQSREVAFEAGEKALQQFYRDRQDKPAHLQRARVNFEAAAKADPAYPAAQHRLAIIADLQERFSESESYYRTAMSLDPSNANIAADLGWSYILQERWGDADRALQRALQLDPNSTIAREHLAKCRQHQSAATQVAATSRALPGQMLANQPATVGPAQGPPAGNWPPPAQPEPQRPAPPIAPDHMGEYLRNQLAQIDQHGSGPAGQPLTIGPRPGAAPAQSNPQQQFAGQPIAQVSGVQPQYGGPAVQAQGYQQPLAQDPAYAARSAPRPTQAPFLHIEPGGPPPRSAPQSGQPQTPPPYAPSAATGQSQRGPSAEWPQQQYGSDRIQRTQSLEPPIRPDQAVYHAPQFPALPSQGAAQGYPQQSYQQQSYQAPQSSVPATGFTQQQPAQPGPTSALDKARRDAALMGLGLGPGQLFPTLEQPAERPASDRISAGSNSHLNGAAFGTPPIRSPDLTPPPDLRQMPSFFEQQPMTPPTNSMGQSMPGGTSSMMTPGAVNDPNARFQQSYVNPAAGMAPQAPNVPNVWNQSGMQSGLQGYDDSRRAADLQLQQTLQNTWTNTPSSAVPSPAGGVPMPGMAPQSQMMNDSWGRQPVAPPPYQQAAPPQVSRGYEPIDLPSVNPSPSRSPSAQADNFPPPGRTYQPLYREGVVVPEQYGPGR